MLMNLAILIYTGRNLPLVGKLNNRLEVFNEMSVCYVTFNMTVFTHWTLGYNISTVSEEMLSSTIDLLPNQDVMDSYGYMMNSLMFYYIYTNILVIFYFIIRQLSLVFTKYCRLGKYYCFGQGKMNERKPKGP